MTKDEKFQIGMALNHIAMSLGDEDFQKVKGYLKDIEKIVAEQTEPKQGTDCTEVEPTTEDCSMVVDNENCMDCVHFEQCTTNGWTDCHYMPIADCPWK